MVDVDPPARSALEIGIRKGEMEAAKAQAIAARTYVAGHLGRT
jgi:peptidoglycan hydrolase-like amidase